MVNVPDFGSLSCRLGGSFFDGRHYCAGDYFDGHLCLLLGKSLVVSVLLLVMA